MPADRRPVRIGVGGPVGTGKTSLVAALCRALATELSIAVVTNDIYTTEDAQLLRRAGVLAQERIEAVRTGGCPHTAIRDDVSGNLEAIAELERRVAGLDLVLIESGGDNLTAVFSPALADRQLFVIDVAGGDDIPRKGGPGIERSDLLVINKRDLAPYVRADPDLMVREARERRAGRPVALVSLVEDPEAAPVAAWVRAQVELARAGRLEPAPAMPHRHTHSHSHVHVAHFSTEGG